MKNSSPASIGVIIAMALAAFADGAAHSQQSFSSDSPKGHSVAVRGCIKAGPDKGGVVLDNRRIKDVADSAIQAKPERDGALVAAVPGTNVNSVKALAGPCS